ncbi:uncharacterized protein LOC133061648 isoform X1 [Dama dama]|uniref:uncharacterized protein LOC133061648 isoform X1 n=1 Tax=Dama dama TaxID=30532 RepID=UPI002A35E749|nr:uncharacterized protein LOC133061648 isoform X1 [Dama dama]
MPKRRAGSRKGWYARQRRSLVERMRQLTIQETVLLPTAQQIQALLQMACCLTVTDVGYSDYSTGWSVDIPGVTKLTGHAQRRNGTGPQDIPFCGLGHKGKHIAVPWKLCRDETATVYSITNDTHSLWDWSPDSERNPGKESNRRFAARIWNLGGTLVYQTEVWKLLAAFETSGSFMQTGEKVKGGFFWNATWRYPRACVPYPFMIIAGSVNLTKNNSQYYIHCFNCTLTSCIRGIRNNSGVLIVKQPPFVMLPVNLTEPWYEESGLELWERVRTALARPRRGIGLIILGVVTLNNFDCFCCYCFCIFSSICAYC